MSVDVSEASVRTDDDEEVCRICRTAATEESPLYFPCACKGSIKYVHQDCLLQWISHSHAQWCEVCKQSFAFSPVYAKDAPTKLPVGEVLLGLWSKGWKGLRFLFRFFLVVFVWLILVPLVTCSLWRLFFSRSLGEARSIVSSRFSPALVIVDCLYGSFLSAGIVCVFLGFTSLRDYYRQVRNHGRVEGGLDPEDDVDAGFDGGGDRAQALVRHARVRARLGWGAADEALGGGEVINPGDEGWAEDAQEQAVGVGGEGDNDGGAHVEDGGLDESIVDEEEEVERGAGRNGVVVEGAPVGGAVDVQEGEDPEVEDEGQAAEGDLRGDQIDWREERDILERRPDHDGNEGVALDGIPARGAALEARMEAHLGQIFDENDVDVNDEVALEELVGLQGPVLHLVENTVTVIVSNALFLVIAVLVPFTIGRIVLALAGHLAFETSTETAVLSQSTVAVITPSSVSNHSLVPNKHPWLDLSQCGEEGLTRPPFWNPEFQTAFPAPVSAISSDLFRTPLNRSEKKEWRTWRGDQCRLSDAVVGNVMVGGDLGIRAPLNGSQEKTHQTACENQCCTRGEERETREIRSGGNETVIISPWLSERFVLLIGYAVVLTTLSFYLLLAPLLRTGVPGQDTGAGRGNGMTWLLEAAPLFGRQMLDFLRYSVIVTKVASLLFLELGIFPLTCGIWLDVCTLQMLGGSLKQRAVFFAETPLVCTLVHWLIGIIYMLQVSIFVSLLRETLRPGVLSFLRDPADPNFDPVRDLVDEPLYKHLWRVFLSFVVYSSLIVMLVYVPIHLTTFTSLNMFPLNLEFSDPFIELPADMLLFHIFVPFTIEHFQPRALIKKVLGQWFLMVGGVLGLTEFLLPAQQEGMGEGNQGMAPQEEGGLQRVIDPLQRPGELQERAQQLERQQAEQLQPLQEQQMEVVQREQMVEELIEHLVPEVAVQEAGAAAGDKEDKVASDWQGEGDGETEVEEAEEDGIEAGMDKEDYMFATRIVVLFICAWLSLVALNLNMAILPVAIGRWIISCVMASLPLLSKGAPCNDLYALGIGCYFLWGSVAAIRCATLYARTHGSKTLVPQTLRWTLTMIKSGGLLSLWVGLIPLLIGLLFDLLVVVPLHAPLDESPKLLYYQDWALGLLLLKIWTRLVVLGQAMPFGIGDDTWRNKFERIRNDGLVHLHGMWVLREVIGPILVFLLTLLCTPYALATGLMALIGDSPRISSVVFRFAWLGSVVAMAFWQLLRKSKLWLGELHNSIRDDRYLVGRQLHNYHGGSESRVSQATQTESVVGDDAGEVRAVESLGNDASCTNHETPLPSDSSPVVNPTWPSNVMDIDVLDHRSDANHCNEEDSDFGGEVEEGEVVTVEVEEKEKSSPDSSVLSIAGDFHALLFPEKKREREWGEAELPAELQSLARLAPSMLILPAARSSDATSSCSEVDRVPLLECALPEAGQGSVGQMEKLLLMEVAAEGLSGQSVAEE